MFRAVVQLVCSRGDGVPLEFLKLESDGRGVLEKATIGQDTVIACWSESMSEAVALAWDRAVLDHQRLFPSSSREHTCLFDFILWSLEPIPINNKDTKLKTLKSFLSVPAMTLVTHVAKFLDDVYLPWALSHVADPGDDDDDQGPFAIHSTGGTKRRRTGTLTTNVVCAKAADRLFRGKDRWASKALSEVSKTVHVRVGQLAHKICAAWLLMFSVHERNLKAASTSLYPPESVYIDGSDIAEAPTEVVFLWSHELAAGAYGPPGDPDDLGIAAREGLATVVLAGAYTAEMAAAVLTKTINDSNYLEKPCCFKSVSCHVLLLHMELDPHCRQLVIDHHKWIATFLPETGSLPCIFPDVLQQLPPEPLFFLPGTFNEKRSRVEGCTLAPRQACCTHASFCPSNLRTDVDVSGLPCPDNSKANHKRKFEQGDSGLIYITWAKDLKIDVVRELLEDDYLVIQLFVGSTDLTYLLSDFEKEQVAALSEQYKQRWGVDPCLDADLVFFLGDRATYSRMWSAVSGKLPTYRRNPGKY
ncbi:unnamed protein product, partial [Symbiodinium necroappetens]